MPSDPNATGAVLAMSASDAAMIGSKPRPGEHRRRDGDRRPEARDAFDERAEAERDEQELDAAIAGQPRERPADDVEVAALDREVVEEDRAHHDPADRPQAERHPVRRRGDRQRQRHAPHQPGEDERGRRRRHRGAPRRDAEDGQQQREQQRRQRRDERGEEHAAADGAVNLMEDVSHWAFVR